MKRLCVLAVTLLLLTGCGPAEGTTPAPGTPSPAGEVQTPAMHRAALFLPDDDARYLEIEEVWLSDLEPQTLVDGLIDRGALPKNVKVLSFTGEEPAILDMSREFGEAMNSTGTAGETMLYGALVHTFLDAFGLDELRVTCEGGVIETGHEVYDAPAAFSPGDLEWGDCFYLYVDHAGNFTADDAEVIWEWDAEKREEHRQLLETMKADFRWGYAILNTCGTQDTMTLADDAVIRVQGRLATRQELADFLRTAEEPQLFQIEREDDVATRLYSLPVGG